MEDVVLHYKPGSSVDLNVLIERTEKLLGPFPCRTPPVFTTWFPVATKDHCLPIKPAKPAPIITSVGQSPTSDSRAQAVVTRPHPANKPDLIAENHHHGPLGTTTARPEDAVCISETLNRLPPSSLFTKADRKITTRSPEKHKDGLPVAAAPFKRSWSVFAQKDAVLQNLHPLSKHFHHMVSIHRLHLRQRAKWVISQHNCGAARDIEQVSQLEVSTLSHPKGKSTFCYWMADMKPEMKDEITCKKLKW